MGKHSRKYRGGEASISQVSKAVETANDLVKQANDLLNQVKEIEDSVDSTSMSAIDAHFAASPTTEPQPESGSSSSSSIDMSDYNNEPAVDLAFKTDTNYKYSNPETSVKLSYPRIIMLLQKLIKQNPTSSRKDVLYKLQTATSQAEVQTIINDSKLRLASNYVMGGKTKRRKVSKRRKSRKSSKH
jgi:hypothetical protein